MRVDNLQQNALAVARHCFVISIGTRKKYTWIYILDDPNSSLQQKWHLIWEVQLDPMQHGAVALIWRYQSEIYNPLASGDG